jgi:general stress protein 26
MRKDEFGTWAIDVMGKADMLTLATIGGAPYPHVRALFNLRDAKRFPGLSDYQANKGLATYLGTNTSSAKAREAGANPWVSVYYMIPSEFKGLCLSGKAVVDPEARAALWVEGWEMYYPEGRDDPDYMVLRIDPVRARCWNAGAAFDVEL